VKLLYKVPQTSGDFLNLLNEVMFHARPHLDYGGGVLRHPNGAVSLTINIGGRDFTLHSEDVKVIPPANLRGRVTNES
jgi:hypothetical protein